MKGKKDGKLSSATSSGGKIRARKGTSDVLILITSHKQLQDMIDMDYEHHKSTDSIQCIDDEDNSSTSTSQATIKSKQTTKNTKNKNNLENKTKSNDKTNTKEKPHKRKLAPEEFQLPAKKLK